MEPTRNHYSTLCYYDSDVDLDQEIQTIINNLSEDSAELLEESKRKITEKKVEHLVKQILDSRNDQDKCLDDKGSHLLPLLADYLEKNGYDESADLVKILTVSNLPKELFQITLGYVQVADLPLMNGFISTSDKIAWINQHKIGIRYLGMQEDDLKIFLAEHGKKITCLNVEGLKNPFSYTAYCPNLIQLIFINHVLSLEEAQQLAYLLERLPRLRELELQHVFDNKPASFVAFQAFIPVLAKLVELRVLNFSSNYVVMSRIAVERLSSALEKLVQLKVLYLNYNRLEAESAKTLAPALKKLVELTDLYLDCNEIGVEGIRALVPSLKNLVELRKLDLHSNLLGDEGTKALIPALEVLVNLWMLDLRMNNINTKGLEALLPALEKLIVLRELGLCHNEIRITGIETLDPTMEQLLLRFMIKKSAEAAREFYTAKRRRFEIF